MNLRFFLVVPLLLWAATAARGDQLVMQNGSILIGTLVSVDGNEVVFNTPFADDITLHKANIKTIVTQDTVTLLMEDGAVFRDKRIVAQEEDLVMLSEEQRPVRFDLPDIQLVNPEPWRLGEGYKWFGKVNVALESERGNTDTDELDMGMESVWRSLKDRYTILGAWEIDESNSERNKYYWRARSKYDRFSTEDPDNYIGAQAAFKHDEFADLDLRTIVGPYVGRQFYESGFLSLQGEVGVVFVDEEFDVAPDNDYWGGTWEMRLTSGLIPGIEIYVDQAGIADFSDSDNLVVNTTVGARFPVIFGFTAGAEAVYEYDGGAVEGVDTTDETYKFKLGYSW